MELPVAQHLKYPPPIPLLHNALGCENADAPGDVIDEAILTNL